MTSEVHVAGIPRGSPEGILAKGIEDVFHKTTNLDWLDRGDTVLIKPSANSPHPYPATTSPVAVETVARILKEKGARVIVGDHSGIGWVLLTADGRTQGSTMDCFEGSGIAQAARNAGAELVAFEELGWDGYVNKRIYEAKNWPRGFYVTEIIDEVDHIINLPRVSTHTMLGVSLGLKNQVGFLRNDSRLEMHLHGHAGEFFTKRFSGELMPTVKRDPDCDIHKMITELFLAIQKKFRLVLYAATEVQTTFGPDRDFFIGPLRVQRSHVAKPDPGLVFASRDIVAAEAVAIAWLQKNIEQTPAYKRILNLYPSVLRNSPQKWPVMTGRLRDKPVSPWKFPMVKRALELKLGSKEIDLVTDLPGWARWELQGRLFKL